MRQMGRRERLLRDVSGASAPGRLVAVTGGSDPYAAGIAPFLELARCFPSRDGVYRQSSAIPSTRTASGPISSPKRWRRTGLSLCSTAMRCCTAAAPLALAGVDDPVND